VAGEYKVQITGLREFQSALKHLDVNLPAELKARFLDIATRISGIIAGKVPSLSGRAAGSVKAHGIAKGATVTAGGARVPYYPWLDFGGGVGRAKSIQRAFVPEGRYMYPTIHDEREETEAAAKDALRDTAKRAGFGWDEL
jgi:hypothetical protein